MKFTNGSKRRFGKPYKGELMMEQEKFPFQEDWPIEGFAIDSGGFVQIRIAPVTKIIGSSVKHWWEVRVSFRPNTSPKGRTCTIRNQSGRELKAHAEHRCIARFETEEEARFFVNEMHQSEESKDFSMNTLFHSSAEPGF